MWIRSRGVSKCSGPYHFGQFVGVGPCSEHPLARGVDDARDQDLLIRWSVAVTGVESLILVSFTTQVRFESVHPGLPRLLTRLHPLHRLVERVSL